MKSEAKSPSPVLSVPSSQISGSRSKKTRDFTNPFTRCTIKFPQTRHTTTTPLASPRFVTTEQCQRLSTSASMAHQPLPKRSTDRHTNRPHGQMAHRHSYQLRTILPFQGQCLIAQDTQRVGACSRHVRRKICARERQGYSLARSSCNGCHANL